MKSLWKQTTLAMIGLIIVAGVSGCGSGDAGGANPWPLLTVEIHGTRKPYRRAPPNQAPGRTFDS